MAGGPPTRAHSSVTSRCASPVDNLPDRSSVGDRGLLGSALNDACEQCPTFVDYCTPDSDVMCDGRSSSRCGSRRRKQLGTAQLPHHSTRSHSSQHSPSTRTRSRSWRRHQAQSNTRSRLLQQAGLSSALSRPRCCPTSRSQHCWPAAWAPRCHCRRHLLPPVATVMLV